MSSIPRIRAFDSTYALLVSDGYRFISDRCHRYSTDIFSTRIMLRKAFCVLGADAAEQFYHAGRFTRRNALPLFALTLIQDVGSVMVLDGEGHRRRKEMFLALMSPEHLARLTNLTVRHWRESAAAWSRKRRIALFHEAHIPLCAAVCEWAGLQLSPKQVKRLAGQFEAMVEGTGTVGPRNWRGHLKRARTERWMRNLVRAIRSGKFSVPEGSPAHSIGTFRGSDGCLMDVKAAAVEIINLLRPTVANARYMVFSAMALHANPAWRDRLRDSDEHLPAFVDEVRRFYPFIPVIGGRVLLPFKWKGHAFRKHDWFLFDIYGTDHDPRIWGDPGVFRPERFEEQSFGPFDLVSHGAGDRRVSHRCPGECITVEQMKAVTRILVREMSYTVPRQNLNIDFARIPALPASRFILTDLQISKG